MVGFKLSHCDTFNKKSLIYFYDFIVTSYLAIKSFGNSDSLAVLQFRLQTLSKEMKRQTPSSSLFFSTFCFADYRCFGHHFHHIGHESKLIPERQQHIDIFVIGISFSEEIDKSICITSLGSVKQHVQYLEDVHP